MSPTRTHCPPPVQVAWRWADLRTGRDDGTVDGLRRGIELLHQLLGVSLEHEMVPLHKVGVYG